MAGQTISGTAVAGAARSYLYDSLNRLTQADQVGSWRECYSFDRYGNRAVTCRTAPLPGLTGETPTLLSQYTAANNRIGSFSYDARGNVTAVPGRPTTVYDAENHQISSVNVNGTSTYAYDGDGRRVSKTVNGVTTTFVYDAMGQLVAEYGGTAVAAGRQYVTVDHLGSTRVVTNSAGAATTFDYLPFGEELNVACLDAPDGVKFTGYRRDQESCLDFAEARYMSSAQGRFTSVDAMLMKKEWLSDPQRMNRYSYVRNNPLRYVDPVGEDLVIYTFLGDDLSDEQKDYLRRNVNQIQEAITAKFKKAGIANVIFRDAGSLTEKQKREIQRTRFDNGLQYQQGAVLLGFADKT